MKTINVSILIILVVSLQVLAQPCALENLLKQPGNWLAATPIAINGINPTDLTRQQNLLNDIVKNVQSKYPPKGIDIEVNKVFFPTSKLPIPIKGGNYYGLNFTFVQHDCPYSKENILKKLSGAYDIYPLRIYINDFGFEFGQSFFVPTAPHQENPRTDLFGFINQPPVKEGAAWYWKDGGGRRNTSDHLWLIAVDGKMPFEYITQKEFAERLKVYYHKKIKEAEIEYETSMKSAEETFEQIKKMNAAEATKFKEQSAVHYKQLLNIAKTQYQKNLVVVENILQTSSPANLAAPAIIDHIKEYFDFEGFVSPDHDYAAWAIKPNPAYFNPKLSPSSPQFMAIYCDTREKPIFKIAREELLKALDFASLQSMLGK